MQHNTKHEEGVWKIGLQKKKKTNQGAKQHWQWGWLMYRDKQKENNDQHGNEKTDCSSKMIHNNKPPKKNPLASYTKR